MTTTTKKPPWKKSAPKGTRHGKLTPAKKAQARRAAKRAGRPYPNLVDNMRAASGGKRGSPKSSTGSKRRRGRT